MGGWMRRKERKGKEGGCVKENAVELGGGEGREDNYKNGEGRGRG